MSKLFKAPITKRAVEKSAAEKSESLPLELQARESEKTAMEKEAFGLPSMGSVSKALTTGIGGDIARSALLAGGTVLGGVAATGAANAIAKSIGNRIDKPKFEAAFRKAVQMDPKLQSHDINDLHRYAELIMEASPSVAMNPLLLSNYLRYLTDYQGSMNLTGYRELANLEGQLLANREKAKPVTGIAQKALIESTIKGISGNHK